jgi:hypothetical protein
MKISWQSAAILVALSVAAPNRVRAGNDDGILLGNDAALTSGAVVASVSDGSALWYNPAGMSRARRDSVDVGASAFELRSYAIPVMLSADDGSRGGATFTEFLSIPSALTYVRRFRERLVGGLAIFTSQQSDATLRTSITPYNAESDVRFRYQSLFSTQGAIYHLALGIGYELLPKLHVGASLFGDYGSFVESSRESFDASTGGTVFALGVQASLVEESVLGFHARFGAIYQATDDLSIGLSVETPAAYFFRAAHATAIASSAVLSELAIDAPALTAESLDQKTREVELGLYDPVRVRLGTSLRVASGRMAIEADVQSRVRDQAIEVDREFVWNMRVGGRFPLTEQLDLGAGFFTDRSAERSDEVGAGGVDFYGGTFGGEYQSVRGVSVDAEGNQNSGLTFATTLALRYAYGRGKVAGQHIALRDGDSETVAQSIRVHELTLHIGSGLYF